MNLKNIEKVTGQVRSRTPEGIIEIISDQMDRRDDAKSRIKKEGIVVRDLKGSVIPHPAIKIEIEASKIIADLLHKHK